MNTALHADAWYAEFEREVLARAPHLVGKSNWVACGYHYLLWGIPPRRAAEKYLSASLDKTVADVTL